MNWWYGKLTRFWALLLLALPGLITLGIYSAFLQDDLRINHGDFSAFIYVGSDFADSSNLLPNISVLPNAAGYDGEFYYRLALDPFTNKPCNFGICFDVARYRQQRILYPLLVKLVTWNNQALVPLAMVFVNLILLSLIGFWGGIYAKSQGKNPIFGLLFSLYIGLYLALLHDLTEITEVFFILVAVVSISKSKPLAAVLLSLSVLSRETAVILAVVILGVAVWQRWKGWGWFILPVLTFGIWQLWLGHNWASGFASFPSLPFVAMAQTLINSLKSGRIDNLCWISVGFFFSLVILALLFKLKAPSYLKISWLLYTALIVSLDSSVWCYSLGYLRVTSDWYAIGLMLLLSPVSQGKYVFKKH